MRNLTSTQPAYACDLNSRDYLNFFLFFSFRLSQSFKVSFELPISSLLNVKLLLRDFLITPKFPFADSPKNLLCFFFSWCGCGVVVLCFVLLCFFLCFAVIRINAPASLLTALRNYSGCLLKGPDEMPGIKLGWLHAR